MATRPSDLLRLLRTHAKPLREAGVTRIKLEGLEVDLAPPEPTLPSSPPRIEDDWGDPLNDPATFGGSMPRLNRKSTEEEFS